MSKQKYVFLAFLGLLVICGFNASLGRAAYTVEITDVDVEFDKNSSTGIVTANISYKFRLNDNYTTLKLYHYCYQEGDSEKLNTKTVSFSNYINGSNGTSGLVSKSTSFTFDPPSDLARGDTLVFYIKIYNASVSASNLIKSKSHVEDYPFTGPADVGSATTSETWLQRNQELVTYALIFTLGIMCLPVLLLLYRFYLGRSGRIP